MERGDFFVLTGASGGGKSTILAALAGRGFRTVEEPGRQVVAEQLAEGGDATPWQDLRKFRDLVFERTLRAYEAATVEPGPVFFDRGLIETLAYSRLIGADVPMDWQHIIATHRYAAKVFVTPPWPAIYRNDAERRKDWEEVLADYRHTADAYLAAGYTLVQVPRAPVEARVAFILERVGIAQ